MNMQELGDIQWLSSMRATYVSTADDKLGQLDSALCNLKVNPHSPTAYRRLDRLLHNLIGSGGSYGLPEVSDAARKMLQRLKQARADGRVASTDLTEEMAAGIDSLRAIFEEASTSDPVARSPESHAAS